MKHKNMLFLLFCVGIYFTGILYAQEDERADELELFEEIPVVITAALKSQKITEAPATIEVYNRKFIENTKVETLAELLRLVAGIDIYFGESGRKEYIGIRGISSRGSAILLMVDNVILNHPNEGHGDLNELSV